MPMKENFQNTKKKKKTKSQKSNIFLHTLT